MKLIASSLFALAFALSAPAYAQADTTQPSSPDDTADDIVVTGHSLRDLNLMAGSVELGGEELLRVSAPQIGELLQRLPGVSATSFAPGASRPILRGLGGDRIRVLLDGIGSIDASSVSSDHGVTLDTLTIDHVDVLHGPAVLVYGGQAIGGAVNAYDKRIPRTVPDGPITLDATAGFSSVSDGKSAGASLDVPLGGGFVGHVDAGWHDDGDLRVGGFVLSAPLREQALEDGDPAANLTGRVDNSWTKGTSFGAGVAFINDGGSLGVSVQRLDSQYGIPSRPGSEESGVSIDLGQTRFDLRGELQLSGLFEALQLRGAFGDYQHAELEGDEIGTVFARKGVETRLDLIQADHGGWTGRSGVQFVSRSLDVNGEEAILPANKDEQLGFYTLQSLKLGRFGVEAAGRIERAKIRSIAVDFERSLTLHSAAVGLNFQPRDGIKLGVNLSHGERAPSAEELLTNGLHLATQAFEIGDPGFTREKSNGVEAFVRYEAPGTRLSLTGFLTDFDDFIAPIPTGASFDGFPIYQYRQLPARFRGVEIEASQQLAQLASGRLTLDASADYVHAELTGFGPAPSIPSLRLMGGLEYAADALTLRGEVEWNAPQNRVGPNEYPTQGFTLANASAIWRPQGKDGPLTLILSGDNLFNVVGRRAASVTRDFMPIAGRNIRLQAKLSF